MKLPSHMKHWPSPRHAASAFRTQSLRSLAGHVGADPADGLQQLLVRFVEFAQPVEPKIISPMEYGRVHAGEEVLWVDLQANTGKCAWQYTIRITDYSDATLNEIEWPQFPVLAIGIEFPLMKINSGLGANQTIVVHLTARNPASDALVSGSQATKSRVLSTAPPPDGPSPINIDLSGGDDGAGDD